MKKTYRNRWLYYRFMEIIPMGSLIFFTSILRYGFDVSYLDKSFTGLFVVWYLMTLYLPILLILLYRWRKREFKTLNTRFYSEVGVFFAHSLTASALYSPVYAPGLMAAPMYWGIWGFVFLCQFVTFSYLEKQNPLKIMRNLLNQDKYTVDDEAFD